MLFLTQCYFLMASNGQVYSQLYSSKLLYIYLGQYTTLSTADLRHHGVITKILITSLKQPKSKREKEKFFQQQKIIAEMMHPNIARHFVFHDQGRLVPILFFVKLVMLPAPSM